MIICMQTERKRLKQDRIGLSRKQVMQMLMYYTYQEIRVGGWNDWT